MRLATIFPESGNKPVAAVSVDAENWVALHPFLKFFRTHDLPQDVHAPLEQFLPVLMPRFSELTRKISDWPEHGRVFQKDGGKTLLTKSDAPGAGATDAEPTKVPALYLRYKYLFTMPPPTGFLANATGFSQGWLAIIVIPLLALSAWQLVSTAKLRKWI